VVDLANTLVHVAEQYFPGSTGVRCSEVEVVWVRERPFVDEFLRFVGPAFEVVVFTLLSEHLADPIISFLERGDRCKFSRRLCREDATQTGICLVKDIRNLGYPMTNVILLDNSSDPTTRCWFHHNMLPLSSWENMDPRDTELKDVISVLQVLLPQSDVTLLLSRETHSESSSLAGPQHADSMSSPVASLNSLKGPLSRSFRVSFRTSRRVSLSGGSDGCGVSSPSTSVVRPRPECVPPLNRSVQWEALVGGTDSSQ
jgi:hypothetical protein